MIEIKKIGNRYFISFLSALLISIIGLLDYITGSEISFSMFYLIPILLLAIYKSISKSHIILNSLFASVIWFLAEFYSREYSNNLIPVWNAFVRFTIFIVVGLLTLNLKNKHKKLIKLNTDLQKINAEKNKFIGITAHDLINPLGTIFSFSDILLTDYSNKIDSNVYQIIHYIKDISNNTLTLVSKLLDISKIESGSIEISPRMQDYIGFVKKHILFNQILADKKEIRIQLETTEKEINFNFDEHYLSVVINNLLTNAVKFSYKKSEILIRVSLTQDNKIKTEIIDKGKGIPIEEQNKLFNYFQKTSTQPTAGEQSTGLGLAIAKKIIIEHNGQIGVNSEIDKGSNFYFELIRP